MNTRFLEWADGRRRRSVAPVIQGARTPEELEALFEDAFVTRDAEALSRCSRRARCSPLARDRTRPAAALKSVGSPALWEGERTYVAEPRRVVQARDIALVLADRAINVLLRGSDGAWRYAIALLSLDPVPTKEEP